jgi:hypothetical protein
VLKEKKIKSLENTSSFVKRIKDNYVLVIFILFIFFFVIRNNNNISELQTRGKQVTGYLYEVKGVGSKGSIRGFYKFWVNDNLYEGFYDNDELVKFSSIEIIYLPENPEKNQAKQFVEDYD